jgi:hypothetical protein
MPAQIAGGYKHQKLEYMATDQAPSEEIMNLFNGLAAKEEGSSA